MAANGMKPTGGKRDGAGRPTDALRHLCQRMMEESGAYKRLKKILSSPKDNDEFLRTIQIVMDRGFGKPMQEVKPIDDSGNYAPMVVYMPAQVLGQEGQTK